MKGRRRSVLSITGITILVLAAWFSFLLLLHRLFLRAGVPADFWPIAQSITGSVTAAAILVGSVIGFFQLRHAAASRYLAVADRLFEELNSPPQVEARRHIFRSLPDRSGTGVAELDERGRAAIKTVLNSLDRVAFLTQSGWIPDDMVMPWMSPMVVKAWSRLAPFVAEERERRREPDFYQRVEELAGRCSGWRKEHLGEAEIVWLRDAL
jgi:hypothetical protein